MLKKTALLVAAMLSLAAGSAFAQKANDKGMDIVRQLLGGVLTSDQIAVYQGRFNTLRASLNGVAKRNSIVANESCDDQAEPKKADTCLAPFVEREIRLTDSYIGIKKIESVLIFARAENSAEIIDTFCDEVWAQIIAETAELDKHSTASAN